MELQQIYEGKTSLLIPKIQRKKGPIKKHSGFYNPLMEFNRDISILVLNSLNKKKILDGLGGCGARGVRIANEVGKEVVINDINEIAYDLIKKNIELNNLKNAFVENKDLNLLLNERKFDYVDIDPYGTPIYFLDNAFKNAKINSVFGITATDTATLCVNQKACLKKYNALSLKTEYHKEIGLRILIGFIAKTSLKYDKEILPLLCYYADHYFRVYVKIVKKKKGTIENLGFIIHNFENGERKVVKKLNDASFNFGNTKREEKELINFNFGNEKTKIETKLRVANKNFGIISFNEETKLKNINMKNEKFAGQLWIGKLNDKKFLQKLKIKNLNTEKRIAKYLHLWKQELNIPYFYETREIARVLKTTPKINDIVEKLKQSGFSASKTHFSPTGFKTNAKFGEIIEILK